MNRFQDFTSEELDAISDGLKSEADLDPCEDPLFAIRVEVADRLLVELEQAHPDTPSVPTDLEEAAARLTSNVYVGTRLLEDLEHAGLLHGNGHHLRQAVAEFAVELLRKRWTGEREASDA